MGLEGQVIESSPHQNYEVVKLSDRVYVCGTYNNKWKWPETECDPYVAIVTYIGYNIQDKHLYVNWAKEAGATDIDDRPSKRVKGFRKELKIKGLDGSDIVDLVREELAIA